MKPPLKESFSSPHEQEARRASLQHLVVTPGAFKAGAVVMLPPKAYEASELKNLIVASTGVTDTPSYWRIISTARAEDSVENGTDRTPSSTVYALRGDNIAMKQNGITDPSMVTYLHPLNQDKIPELPPAQSVLIYSARHIRNVSTPNTPFPNTKFFCFTKDPKQSLLAIISPALIQSSKPNLSMRALKDGPG